MYSLLCLEIRNVCRNCEKDTQTKCRTLNLIFLSVNKRCEYVFVLLLDKTVIYKIIRFYENTYRINKHINIMVQIQKPNKFLTNFKFAAIL